MAKQAELFEEGVVEVSAGVYVNMAKHPMCVPKKRQTPDSLLKARLSAAYHLSAGESYGILCRRFEGWYIKAIMAYLKQSGINAVYEKMHEKGLGFTGYLIKLKGK